MLFKNCINKYVLKARIHANSSVMSSIIKNIKVLIEDDVYDHMKMSKSTK